MRVLITGAEGFIGRQVAAAVAAAGHEVVAGVRRPEPAAEQAGLAIRCDFATDLTPAVWQPRLTGIDAVVNCVGILRERGAATFERVHVQTPRALYRACQDAGVRRVVQISALGSPADGEFVASKHRGDAGLAALDLDWAVVRPSVVYSPRGSYGGTSLLRAMAALPGLLIVPGDGQQPLDPISAEDLSALVVALLETRAGLGRIIEAVGPETLTLTEYLLEWRRWLRAGPAVVLRMPRVLVGMAAWLGERFGDGPLGRTMHAMLERGNTGGPGAAEIMGSVLGRPPRTLSEALAEQPAFVQDRWHARLYLLEPVLRVSLALVWLASGVVGFVTPREVAEAQLAGTALAPYAMPIVIGASALDLLLGVLLLVRWRPLLVGSLMLISVIGYTASIGWLLPQAWLEPLGGLLKNLVLLPAILVMMALVERR